MTDGTVQCFIEGDLCADLTSVPGICPASVTKLSKVGVRSTYHLLGTLLTLYDTDVSTEENAVRAAQASAGQTTLRVRGCVSQRVFYNWLGTTGVARAYKATITRLMFEKIYVLMPGLVDLTEFEG